MATATDLMGLGESPFLAPRVSNTPTAVTSSGASLASSTRLGPFPGIFYVNASNAGSGLSLPNVGGTVGCLLGDCFCIFNLLSTTINVYASNSSTIYMNSTSNLGTTGIGVDAGYLVECYPITPTSWVAIRASA